MNAQNENMIMQSERDKLLGEKAQDQAILLEDIIMINALTEKLNEKDMLLQRTKTAFEELVNGNKYRAFGGLEKDRDTLIDKIESLHDNGISEYKQDIVEEPIERQLKGDIRAIERKIDEVQTMLSYQNKMQENQRPNGVEETVLNLKLKSAEIQNTFKSYYQCGDQQNKLSRLETTMADMNLQVNKIEQSIGLLSNRNQ